VPDCAVPHVPTPQGWVEETEGGGLDVGGMFKKLFNKGKKKN
jgi:hypothetical protein